MDLGSYRLDLDIFFTAAEVGFGLRDYTCLIVLAIEAADEVPSDSHVRLRVREGEFG
jgi:hypothetical protein